jgi:hypothetical protein
VSTAVALDGMLRPLENLSAPARAVRIGAPADLVLLNAGLDEVLKDPDADRVVATFLGGRVVGS